MIKIIDDFLSKPYFSEIKDRIENPSYDFAWYYKPDITDYEYVEETDKNLKLSKFGFNHVIMMMDNITDPEYYLLLTGFYGNLLEETGCSELIRSRFDMTTFSPFKVMHAPHTDLDYPHVTSIFYLTDSDAETVIYNEKYDGNPYPEKLTVKKKILPKENRLLIFDGLYFHTGYSPSNYKRRVLINTNLK